METIRLGRRNVVFRFPELECNLLAIYGDVRTYLCDTFLGPEPMEEVKRVFQADGRHQPIVVFNSHSHWDHVWGNSAFPGSLLVAHEACAKRLKRVFDEEFKAYGEQAQGQVVLRLPELMFTNRVTFADDGVAFFYSPGHSDDSASCLDLRDHILFVGDNVEAPIPYLGQPDLDSYVATLERYLEMNPETYVAGHGVDFPRQLLEDNLAYVRNLAMIGEVDTAGWSEDLLQRHQENLEVLKSASGGPDEE